MELEYQPWNKSEIASFLSVHACFYLVTSIFTSFRVQRIPFKSVFLVRLLIYSAFGDLGLPDGIWMAYSHPCGLYRGQTIVVFAQL